MIGNGSGYRAESASIAGKQKEKRKFLLTCREKCVNILADAKASLETEDVYKEDGEGKAALKVTGNQVLIIPFMKSPGFGPGRLVPPCIPPGTTLYSPSSKVPASFVPFH